MNVEAHPTTSRLVVRTANLKHAKPPEWAWENRVPLGVLSLIVGEEGIGKGTAAAWLLARLTRGDLAGDLHGKPVTVGVLADEDSFDSVWTPRLHAAGADLSHVRHVAGPDGSPVELAQDRTDLEAFVTQEEIAVLYLDALIDNLGPRVDDWKSKPVRDALQPLKALAKTHNIAALCSLHPNKGGRTFREKVQGSHAFNAISRSSLWLTTHPEDTERRVLIRPKGNLSRQPQAFEFDIETSGFEANGYAFNVPVVGGVGYSDLREDDLLGVQFNAAGESRTQARDVLTARLADGQWHASGPIITDCEGMGIYKLSVQRARHDLDVEQKWEGMPAKSYWRRASNTTSTQPVTPVTPVIPRDISDNSHNSVASSDTPTSTSTASLSIPTPSHGLTQSATLEPKGHAHMNHEDWLPPLEAFEDDDDRDPDDRGLELSELQAFDEIAAANAPHGASGLTPDELEALIIREFDAKRIPA